MDTKKFSLTLVGVIWLLVGMGLMIVGIKWFLTLKFGPKLIMFILLSVSIGLLKGKFVIQKVALKYYNKSKDIKFNKADIFTGWIKILGVRGFILIGLMMVLGSLLRHSSIDRPVLGVIYVAVGIALVYASKIFFEHRNTT